MARSAQFSFSGLTIEGNLIAPAILKVVADPKGGDATGAGYDIPRGVTLRDEMARYYRIGQATLRHLHASPNPSLAATERFAAELLTQVLGFPDVRSGETEEYDGRFYPVSLQALDGRVPVLVVTPNESLDAPSIHLRPDGRRRSAATALQDWLNVSDPALWGLCTNGKQLRLLRDNPSLTRPAFLDFDLLQIFDNEDYSSFTLLWLLLHRSRFGKTGTPPTDCQLERWRDDGAKTGELAVKRLAGNVEEALTTLANGLLAHPSNADLRQRLESGTLALSASSTQASSGTGHSFFSQLLRLVYRLIFLLAAEDRDLLHPPDTTTTLRELYATGYSVGSLRDRAIRRASQSGVENTYGDRWQGLTLVFRALAHGDSRLGLPALGGLFRSSQTPDIDTLQLSNRVLFDAMYKLAWLRDGNVPVRVDWRNMQTEELGSVYEGLLELTPRLADDARSITFATGAEQKGNERKTSGSYYTPDSLVQTLLDSALDPVLDRMESESATNAGPDPAAHLLTITVLDPACGSGHFLLAAARRIATRVARLRAGGVPSVADYRHALRDAVRLCIYGVDRNPMAVELSRVALWIETVEPGRPLGFLDANLRCGDALLGVFSLEALTHGIPDAAYKPLAGDDRAVTKVFAARNKEDLKGQGRLGFHGGLTTLAGPPTLAADALALRALPEESEGDISQREQAFQGFRANPILTRYELAADLYVAAFLIPKVKPAASDAQNSEFLGMPLVPVTSHVWRVLDGKQILGQLTGAAQQAAKEAHAFHWPLEFPHILLHSDEHRRGFDVVLGNPPWEVMQLNEIEFFSAYSADISDMTSAKRKRAIADLQTAHPVLFGRFQAGRELLSRVGAFIREAERFNLTAIGKLNTYSLFAELAFQARNILGQAGLLIPTGIAFDDSTQTFFQEMIRKRQLVSLFSFYEVRRWFPGTDDRKPFCLFTLGNNSDDSLFAFDLRSIAELSLKERLFRLSEAELNYINPNTRNAPVFRSRFDAALASKIYRSIPILMNEQTEIKHDSWKCEFRQGLFNMASDSGLFLEGRMTNDGVHKDSVLPEDTSASDQTNTEWLPLLEAKMLHIFDHRWTTYDSKRERAVTLQEHQTDTFETQSRYWVSKQAVRDRISGRDWVHKWLLGWRFTVGSEGRTFIPNICPLVGIGHTFLLVFPEGTPAMVAALYGCFTSLVCDYCAKQKVGGSSLMTFVLKQLPILPPSAYKSVDLAFIIPRVRELTYTSHSMTPFARDLGYAGEPFRWDEDRRAQLRAELDAWYARAYGLSRDDLRYILDPKDLMGADYPSETFRVLQKNEVAKYGFYRTQSLVLAAWDRQAAGLPALSEGKAANRQLPVTQVRAKPRYEEVSDGAWIMPQLSTRMAAEAAAAQLLSAIIQSFTQPPAEDNVRLIYHFAKNPRKFTTLIQGGERDHWIRLVGADASLSNPGVFQMALRSDMAFGAARNWLVAKNALSVDTDAKTLQLGPQDSGLPSPAWAAGRAQFVQGILEDKGYETFRSSVDAQELEAEQRKHA